MKNKVFVFLTSVCLFLVPVQNAQALVCPYGGSPSWNGQCETTTDAGDSYFGPPMTQEEADGYVSREPSKVIVSEETENSEVNFLSNTNETTNEITPTQNFNVPQNLIDQNYWSNISIDPEINNDEINSISESQQEMWAVVDQNGNTLNIIVCNEAYCGSGWIPTNYVGNVPTDFVRVVLQGSRDPESGKYNGGHWGKYNFESNTWTKIKDDGSVYQIPVEYGAEPFCIANCPILLEENGERFTTENTDSSVTSEPRSFNVVVQKTNKTVSFKQKFPNRKNIKSKNIWVIATKGAEKFVWKFRAAKNNKTNIVLPIKYADWNISVNYILKNNKRVSNKIFLI